MPNMRCKCGTELTMSDPAFEIVNQLTVSMIVINHGMMTGKKCPTCGQEFFCGIQEFNMAAVKLAVIPVPEQPEKNLITTDVPPGFNPKRPM